MPHHHHHSNSCGCDHDLSNADSQGPSFSLYLKINFSNVTTLNEVREDSGKDVFKSWDNRKDTEKFVESDADEELLINIPFTGVVKLKGLIVIGGEDGRNPDKVRMFKNRPHMTFGDAEAKADQEIELALDTDGSIVYSPKPALFSSVEHLSLHFPSNEGGMDSTKIYYVGLKGDFMEAHRVGVVNAVYEARPMLEDHKADLPKDVNASLNF